MNEDSMPVDEAQGSCSPVGALRCAREEFEKAQAKYHKLREGAAERVKSVRQTSVGDVVDAAIDVVRRHPGKALDDRRLAGAVPGATPAALKGTIPVFCQQKWDCPLSSRPYSPARTHA